MIKTESKKDAILPPLAIDLELLVFQKHELVRRFWNEPDNVVWGLIEMLDNIQDTIDPPTPLD